MWVLFCLLQKHYPITVEDGGYTGMRASIISKTIGEYTRRNYWQECCSWGIYSRELGCPRWGNGCWCPMQNYRGVIV